MTPHEVVYASSRKLSKFANLVIANLFFWTASSKVYIYPCVALVVLSISGISSGIRNGLVTTPSYRTSLAHLISKNCATSQK